MEASIGGVPLHYEIEGDMDGSTVTLSHSLGSHSGIWEPQRAALRNDFQVLRYDTRGHGASSTPLGPYGLRDLVEDVCGLLDALQVERTHFVGISMGGMIGQLLALEHPERLRSLVLADTTSEIPEAMQPMWDERIRVTRQRGMEPHVEPTMERWFTEGFRRAHPEVVDQVRTMVRNTDPSGYVACCRAIQGLDLTERLEEIRTPTLVVVGADDPGTTPEVARAIHERIPGSELEVIDSAAHLCNMEQAGEFNRVVKSFLERQDGG